MNLVVDASVVVAALLDDGPAGVWAEGLVEAHPLAAPHLVVYEVANIVRRTALRGVVPDDVASAAHADLLALPIALYDYEPLASRVWELRRNVTVYDATYVALAEALGAPLATLDRRLAAATGSTCRFLTVPDDV